MWAAWAVDTMWGTVGPRIPLVSGSSTVTLNGIDDWTLNVDRSWLDRVQDKWFTPYMSSVLIAHSCKLLPGWSPVCFGPLTAPPTTPDHAVRGTEVAAPQATLTGKGMRQMLTKRVMTGGIDYNGGNIDSISGAVKRFDGYSLGTIQEELVRYATSRAAGTLPIRYDASLRENNLPDDDDHSREYDGYNISNCIIDSLISGISATENGPDFMLRPGMDTDGDSWRAYVTALHGTSQQPQIPQKKMPAWDATAARGIFAGYTPTVDATNLTNRAWSVGSGEGAGTLLGVRQNDAQLQEGMPLLESVASYSSVVVRATLESHAGSRLDRGAASTVQADVSIRCDDGQGVVGTWWVGDRVMLTVPDSVELPGGERVMTIISAKYDVTKEIATVSLQEDHVNGKN